MKDITPPKLVPFRARLEASCLSQGPELERQARAAAHAIYRRLSSAADALLDVIEQLPNGEAATSETQGAADLKLDLASRHQDLYSVLSELVDDLIKVQRGRL